MNIEKATVFILRVTKYRESDLIFVALSEKGEQISFFVRGGYNIKSNYTGIIKPGNFLDLVYRKSKNLNYPTEISLHMDLLYSFHIKSLRNLYFWSDIIKITLKTSVDYSSKELYNLVKHALKNADKNQDKLVTIYIDFLTEVISMSGEIYNVKNSRLLQEKIYTMFNKSISLKFSGLTL